jgi:integrase
MTAVGAALVLLPTPDRTEPTSHAFDVWLQEAGWDAQHAELRPPPHHETFGYRVCAVDACPRVAWGQANAGMCPGCASAWIRAGRPDREVWYRQSPNRDRWHHTTNQCAVQRDGKRCQRPAGRDGLCVSHSRAISVAKLPRDQALASLEPLPSYGQCRVASCNRATAVPKYGMCVAHAGRWVRLSKIGTTPPIENWCRTERPVSDSRCVNLAGLPPLVIKQTLFGVFNRSRRDAHTRLEVLQRVVDFLRELQPTDLRLLDTIEIPAKWPMACRPVLNMIMLTARYGDRSPEEFKHADVWPGYVFGRGSKLNFTGISQPWLRSITQSWCWDNLNRFNDFGSFIKAVNEIGYFSEYLSSATPGGGNDITGLNRSTVTGFADYLAARVRNGDRRDRSKRPGPGDRWTRNMQANCLVAVQRVLKYGRETDQMADFAGSFVITDDLLVRKTPRVDRDDPGDALPTMVMRQLFAPENLGRLGTVNDELPRLLRIAAETGRRPGELLSLFYECLDLDSAGGPYLVYTESKVTGGQERRLPVLDVVVQNVQNQQEKVRKQFPDTPTDELRLFPRPTMNPRGLHPFSSATFGKTLRTWVGELPTLDSEQIAEDGTPIPVDRSRINAYSFRHTYAQRHADAGTPPDVLKELMGHEKIQTTMGYYNYRELHQTGALSQVA